MTHPKPQLSVIDGGQHNRRVEALYLEHRQSLLGYLSGIVPGGRSDAQEILHETYIRLLRQDNLDHLDDNPRAYIFTIATNLARDHLRRRASRRHNDHCDIDDCELKSAEIEPQQSADWQQSLEQVKRALLQLKPQTRKIFALSRFEELTYPEIAQRLNVSTRTVERHMSSAAEQLRAALGNTFSTLMPNHD